jgi:hypothetical protein
MSRSLSIASSTSDSTSHTQQSLRMKVRSSVKQENISTGCPGRFSKRFTANAAQARRTSSFAAMINVNSLMSISD